MSGSYVHLIILLYSQGGKHLFVYNPTMIKRDVGTQKKKPEHVGLFGGGRSSLLSQARHQMLIRRAARRRKREVKSQRTGILLIRRWLFRGVTSFPAQRGGGAHQGIEDGAPLIRGRSVRVVTSFPAQKEESVHQGTKDGIPLIRERSFRGITSLPAQRRRRPISQASRATYACIKGFLSPSCPITEVVNFAARVVQTFSLDFCFVSLSLNWCT